MMEEGKVYSAAVAGLHRTGRSGDRSVPRRRRIDLERPGVDATGHVLGAREAPLSQEARDAQAATAMVAVDDDATRTMRFEEVESCGDLRHRHEDRAGDVRRRMLVGLTAVEEQEALAARYRAGGMGYGEAKTQLLQQIDQYFGPFRDKRKQLAADPEQVEAVLKAGAAKARAEAQKTMELVRKATGLSR